VKREKDAKIVEGAVVQWGHWEKGESWVGVKVEQVS
jgi:hypothetical protein